MVLGGTAKGLPVNPRNEPRLSGRSMKLGGTPLDPFCNYCKWARSVGVKNFSCGECLKDMSMPLCRKCAEYGHPIVQFRIIHPECRHE